MNAPVALLAAALLVGASPAGAVVIRSADANGPLEAQPAAPTPDPGLAHLAVVAGLSGVYVGNGWVLTAGHVLTAARNQKKSEARIGGRAFVLKLDAALPLARGSDRADLALVPVAGDVGLPSLPIVRKTPDVGAALVLAGNGPLQESRRLCWDASGLEVPSTRAGARCGFRWWKTPEGETNGVHWGTNQVASVGALMPGPQGTRTRSFVTEFREDDATRFEAQAGVGDSGGPVFVERADGWALAGVLLGVAAQSPAAAIFGDRTYAADLSVYRDAILRVVAPNERPATPGKKKRAR